MNQGAASRITVWWECLGVVFRASWAWVLSMSVSLDCRLSGPVAGTTRAVSSSVGRGSSTATGASLDGKGVAVGKGVDVGGPRIIKKKNDFRGVNLCFDL